MSAIEDVIAERQRQINVEGWTDEHDDEHTDGSMAQAAACYALGNKIETLDRAANSVTRLRHHQVWPWAEQWWKPKDRRRNLVRAGALILAEIDRLDRLSAEGKETKG